MKKDMPLDGLRWSRNSDSALNNMPQTDVLGRAGGGNCAVTLREPHSCKAFRRCLSRRLRKAFCVLALTN